MKLITWNCNMAFRKKARYVLHQKPDIVIVPECECLERLIFDDEKLMPKDIVWHGKNLNKGIGVFSYSDYRFKLLECHNTDFKNILPISVTGGKVDFILFAIWANNPEDKDGHYVTQIWKALHHYEDLIAANKAILVGDFNSNTIWDRPKREGNHSRLVEKLEAYQIFSTYHYFHHQQQGKEEHATLFLYRHQNKPYHMDYCFASHYFVEKLKHVEIGSFEEWATYSDHCPLTVEFNL